MHYSDFNTGTSENFKPSDIIDEDNETDDEVLKKFRVD